MLSPEERERRFRKSKHKKLKVDLDEETKEETAEVQPASPDSVLCRSSLSVQEVKSEPLTEDQQISHSSLSTIFSRDSGPPVSSGVILTSHPR